jgi:hypothetical protein
MSIYALGKEPFPTALATSREGSAPAFRPHPGTKTVLALARPFRWLVSAFHKAGKYTRRELRAVTLGWSKRLSILSIENVDSFDLVRKLPFISRVARVRDFWNKQCKR